MAKSKPLAGKLLKIEYNKVNYEWNSLTTEDGPDFINEKAKKITENKKITIIHYLFVGPDVSNY